MAEIPEGLIRAKKLAEQGLAEVEKNRAINNYDKHYKHNKNEINTVKDNTGDTSGNQEDLDFVPPWQASPSEHKESGQEAKRGSVSAAPQTAISYLKIDLFNNASDKELEDNIYKLHVKLSVKKHNDPNWLHASASLNSEKRMAKRGLRMDDPKHRAHWDTVEQIYSEMRADYKDTKVSKFYQAGGHKGKSIKGLSIVLSHGAGIGIVIKGTDMYAVKLSDQGLNQAQRRKHMIMSGTWTDDTVRPDNELNVDDWLGE